MIARIWHGWTSHENADAYEQLLKTEIFRGIADEAGEGYKSIQLLRHEREEEDEVEFVTIMLFDSLEAVKQFAGEDYTHSYVPAEAREVLKRFDDHAKHYEIREVRTY